VDDRLSAVLGALSHPSRRAIIDDLAQGPKRSTDVAQPFDLALNSITKHLKLLDRVSTGRNQIESFGLQADRLKG